MKRFVIKLESKDLKNKDEKFLGFDSNSGGYPYAASFRSAEIYESVDEAVRNYYKFSSMLSSYKATMYEIILEEPDVKVSLEGNYPKEIDPHHVVQNYLLSASKTSKYPSVRVHVAVDVKSMIGRFIVESPFNNVVLETDDYSKALALFNKLTGVDK